MGLFNLGKKKDIPLPLQPGVSQSGLQQTEPAPTDEGKQESNFDEFQDEVPTPPSDLSITQPQLTQPALPGANPFEKPQATAESRGLPYMGMPSQPKTGQGSTGLGDKIIYELPDFLDEETKAMEEANFVKKETEKKSGPVKQASQGLADPEIQKSMISESKTESFANKSFLKQAVSPESVKPRTYPEPRREAIYQEPVKPKTYPKTEAPPQEVKLPAKEPFMDLNKYFELKDDFETIRKLISTTQDKLEHEAMLSKEKSDKYQAVAETINYLQEKLMLMDTKLFES